MPLTHVISNNNSFPDFQNLFWKTEKVDENFAAGEECIRAFYISAKEVYYLETWITSYKRNLGHLLDLVVSALVE